MRIPPDYCLLGRKKSGVVTDGLICWIDGQDGIYNTDNNSYFFDRATGNNIIITQNIDGFIKNNSKIAVSDNKTTIQFLHDVTLYKAYIDSIPIHRGNFTIELNSKITKSSQYSYTLGVSSKVVNHYGNLLGQQMVENISGYGLKIGTKFNVSTAINLLNTEYQSTYNIMSVVQDGSTAKLYVNGLYFGSVDGEFATSVVYPFFFFLDKTKGDLIEIGSIKVYDKKLTESEILQNYAYEKSLGRVT